MTTFKRGIALVAGSLVVLGLQTHAWGQPAGGTAGSEAWYKIVTGIIGIPAAAIGLIISINLLRKTTLESRKLELEIREKQITLEGGKLAGGALEEIAKPIGDSQRALLLVVRFAVLELTLRLWSIVPASVAYLTGAIPVALFFTVGEKLFADIRPTSASGIVILVVPRVINDAFGLIYWIIVFGFGWPLLKDTCRFLGIPVESLLDLPFLGRRRQQPPAAA